MDWVPMVGYGVNVVIPPQTNVFIALYPLPDYSGGTAEFLYEDEEESTLFLERIVGTAHMTWSNQGQFGDNICGWRLMPLGVDYDTGQPLLPFGTPVLVPNDSEWANLRWWDERYYNPVDPVGQQAVNTEVSDHPHWTMVDINPRQMLGQQKNLWPCAVVTNQDPISNLLFRHRWRALWKS